MVSIHTSKGDGREAVFLLDISEMSLKRYSGGKEDVIYESLLHVGITRQKKHLIIGITEEDAIYDRFVENGYNIKHIGRKIKVEYKIITTKQLIDYICENDSVFQKMMSNNKFAKKRDILENKIVHYRTDDSRILIDMKHHNIRYFICVYYFMSFIEKIYKPSDKNEFNDLLCSIAMTHKEATKRIIMTESIEEYDRIKDNYVLSKYKKMEKIPILVFRSEDKIYRNYAEIIGSYIINIRDKIHKGITRNNQSYPILCPFECAVLGYIICLSNSRECEAEKALVSIIDLYKILDSYTKIYKNKISPEHEKLNCLCKKYIGSDTVDDGDVADMSMNLVSHYDKSSLINILFEEYRKSITDYVPIDNETKLYLFEHIEFEGNKKYKEIIEKMKLSKVITGMALTKEYIILYFIKPLLNGINKNRSIIEMIISSFIVHHSSYEINKKRVKLNDHKILACAFSIELNKPIILEMDFGEQEWLVIKEIVKDFFFFKNERILERFYDKFDKYGGDTPIEKLKNMIDDIENNKDEGYLPYMYEIPSKIMDKIKDESIDRYLSKDGFISELKNRTIELLDSFLGIK
jgi:hypothetical protein